MKSIKTAFSNIKIGANPDGTPQDGYTIINAVSQFDPEFGTVFTSAWEMDRVEAIKFLTMGRFWYQRCTFSFPPGTHPKYPEGLNNPFQPMGLSVDNPLNDKSDDLLAKPLFPIEAIKLLERYARVRNSCPEEEESLAVLDRLLPQYLDKFLWQANDEGIVVTPSELEENYMQLAMVALRLSKYYQNLK